MSIKNNDKDIFFHLQDSNDDRISDLKLRFYKDSNPIYFSFRIINYHGKYKCSLKAVNLKLATELET